MEKDLILRGEDLNRLNVVLTKLIDSGRIDCTLLINKSGRLLTSQSEGGAFDKTSLAALVAASFASTIGVANLIGEEAFQKMVHQGRRRSTYVAVIDDNTVIAHIYGGRTSLEKVRAATQQFTVELQTILADLYASMEHDPEMNVDVSVGGGRSKASSSGDPQPLSA
jgi:predicted regulator of Ras-like GTPase activity (Roadblock/LC7/MglB family)